MECDAASLGEGFPTSFQNTGQTSTNNAVSNYTCFWYCLTVLGLLHKK